MKFTTEKAANAPLVFLGVISTMYRGDYYAGIYTHIHKHKYAKETKVNV